MTTSQSPLSLAFVLSALMVLSLDTWGHTLESAGDSAEVKATIKDVLSEDFHDKKVEISGVVLRQVGPGTVIIHDGTAAIEVDVPPEQLPIDGLRPNTRIRIKGEVAHEHEGNHEVEANQLFWSF